MSDADDPYRPPQDTTAFWHFDRSGVGQRVLEILAVSAVSACVGQFIGGVFFPQHNSNSDASPLIVIVPVIALTIWFAVKTTSMWKRDDDDLTAPDRRLDSEKTVVPTPRKPLFPE